ncbi:hypothetical protein PVAND_009265 [Polypedilum vanderplanki]|uniref:RRM domain-containing protein n=1 Tax=Polypedilum vanderplanki TaxID=319348 RepID=A0A9J6CDK1_POLVA|nr:hypothetical protein PVAND_009265 [Polypedilum vanderplanki]
MASTGKKGKKSKEKKLSLQDFLAKSNPQTGSGTTQVAVTKYSSWAEECEEDEDRKFEIIQLPTAPRAARILDDNSIPNEGPFYARVSNLPFDINEGDVDEFFLDQNIHIREMRLARDEQNDRLRGYGHIEFETRDDLLDAIMLTDPMIRNRRIRIEFTAEPDNSSGRTVRKRYDNYTPRDSANESTNWRDRKESNFEAPRSTFQNRHESSNDGGNDSNWRLGERPNDSPPPERRRYGNDRRDGEGGRRGRYNDREQREQVQEERPKLNLAPRTLPLPEMNFPKEEELERNTRKISLNGDRDHSHDDSGLAEDDESESKEIAPKPKPVPVPRENVFGSAKPVDTTAREREIEEKMEQERQEKLKAEKEKRMKERETTSQSDTSNKDVIVIRTESSRRQDGETNWRKRDENSSNGFHDNKSRGGGNRQMGRSDDRPRQFNKDNRDNRNFNNRGGGMNRDRRDRDNNMRRGNDQGMRRNNDYHNSGGNEMRREEREREPRRERNYEMPKYVENSGPNLKTSNLFDGLDEEVNDD